MEIEIRHTRIRGIDTAKLEKQMRAIDWNKHPGHWLYGLDDPLNDPLWKMRRIEKKFNSVMGGANTPKQALIWEHLMLKYWSDTPLEHAISQNVPYLEANFTEYHELKAKSMNAAINYYELKTQLTDLGFSEPTVTDQLRQFILAGEQGLPNIELTKTAGGDQAHFTLFFGRDTRGQYELTCIDCSMDKIGIPNNQHMQYFQPDVPAASAIELLQLDRLQPHLTRDAFIPLNHKETQEQIRLLKTNTIMNMQNLSYLQKQLLNLGFGEALNKDLEKNIEAKTPEFTLSTTQEYNKQNVAYTLHYKAGDKDEMYFFNKYDASMNGTQQTFYLNKGSGITAKEAYNLMEGRAVHKQLENLEGEKYHAWLILDKENKTENGNFKLRPFTDGWNYKPERAIDKLDIVGINEEGARDKLMKSLEKGNRHQVTAMKDGKEVKLFLEANPAEHRVNLTNWKGEAQQLEHYKKPELKQESKKAETQSQETSKKKSKGHKMSV